MPGTTGSRWTRRSLCPRCTPQWTPATCPAWRTWMRRCSCSVGISSPTPRWRCRGSARTKFSAATRGTATPRMRERYGFHGRSPRPTARRSSSPVCWAASTRQRSWMNAIAPRWHRHPVRPGLPAAEQRMRQMMNLNFKWFMQTLLDRKDRMSMYSGLEVRVPFCDYRIAGVSLLGPMGVQGLSRAGKGPPARGHARRAARRGSVAAQSPYPKTWNPSYLAAVSAELRTVLNDPAAPLLRIIRADALETLLASGG